MPYLTPRGLPRMLVILLGLLFLPSSWGQKGEPLPLKEASLEQAIAQAESLPRLQALLVAHHGEPVIEYAAEEGELSQPANIKSLSKTIMSALIGIAIDRGVFSGVEQPVTELLDGRVPENTDPRINEISVGNLLSMQAGLERTSGPNYGRWIASDDWVAYILARPFVDEPGGGMLYSTGNTHLLSAALTDSSGHNTHELAQAWLGEPLKIAIPPWTRDPQGIYLGGNEMALSPRALLAFGELYRQGGVVDGQRVLSEAWIEASWQPRTRSVFNHDQYGYGWFITKLDGQRIYYGWGYAGQMLYVIPDLDMTVVMVSDPTPPSPGRSYLRRLEKLVTEVLIPSVKQ